MNRVEVHDNNGDGDEDDVFHLAGETDLEPVNTQDSMKWNGVRKK